MKNFDLVQRLDLIKEFCRNKKVLHLGCTNFPYTKEAIENDMLLHHLIEKISKEVYGFDFDREGIEILERSGATNLYRADLENLEQVDLNESFDVIVAGEIIEHLNNPGLFFKGVQKFMTRETKLIITTVNAYCALRFFIYGLRGKGGEVEPVHPDHVAYYSYKTLKLAIERADMVLDEFYFYDLGKEHRPHNPWYYNFVNDISVKFSKQLSDGIIAVCSSKQN